VPIASLMLMLALSIAFSLPSMEPTNHGIFVSGFCNIPVQQYRPTAIKLQQMSLGVRLNTYKTISSRLGSQSTSDEGLAVSSDASPRSIRVERNPRLPVWPVWAGVIDFFVGLIFGPEAGSKLEQYVLGGRVCPMQFDGRSTSPFLLLVHHHHNFWKWDAIFRKISALVLPEGFPAHPHRGFTTLTYFLDNGGGGFVHRDSIGVKQTYGAKGSYQNQAQWLFTGRGMLHEEMFDFVQNDFGEKNPGYNPRYELYQLWINVPGKHKLDAPKVQLLRETDSDNDDDDDDEFDTIPRVTSDTIGVSLVDGKAIKTHSEVVVIAGSYRPHEHSSNERNKAFASTAEPLHSDLSVLHVNIEETETSTINISKGEATCGWIYDIPTDHDTLIVYVRKGSCTMETVDLTSTDEISSSPTDVPIHSTVFVEKESNSATNERLIIRSKELDDPVDLLVLSGKPLYRDDGYENAVEPVAMQGSMVMNNNAQIQQAYTDYQYGQMGVPWDHELGDDEWMEHVRQTKPRMANEITTAMQEYDSSSGP